MIVARAPEVSTAEIRARREALGISRATLAIEAQCSASMIAVIEKQRLLWSRTLPNVLEALDRLEAEQNEAGAVNADPVTTARAARDHEPR